MRKSISCAALLAAAAALPAAGQAQSLEPGDRDSSGMMEHGSMGMGKIIQGDDGTGTGATGVINSGHTAEGVVNITHGPILSLNWPEMTRDLPVADDVDLAGEEPGDEARFRVELGRDKVYRTTDIKAST